MRMFDWLRRQPHELETVPEEHALAPEQVARPERVMAMLTGIGAAQKKRAIDLVVGVCYDWNGRWHPDFMVALLAGIAEQGDPILASSIGEIVRVRAGSVEERRVHRAAVNCLARLKERVEEERERNTLVRPAVGGPYSTEGLLQASEAPDLETPPD
jgi:hypothetical protein